MMERIRQLCAPSCLTLVCCFAGLSSSAQCPPANSGDATNYVPINETLYDRTYSSIGSGNNPLGFNSSVWYYNQNQPEPCIKLTAPQSGVTNLEIMVEPLPSARLCARTSDDAANYCFNGQNRWCSTVNIDNTKTIYVEFYCDSGCEEADVNFWYRLVLMPPGEDLDNWCSNDRHSQYPTDLMTLPPDMTLPSYNPQDPNPAGAAYILTMSQSVLLAAFCFWSVWLH